MKETLKPCPFCGTNILEINTIGVCCQNVDCGATMPAKQQARAIKDWNTRPTPTPFFDREHAKQLNEAVNGTTPEVGEWESISFLQRKLNIGLNTALQVKEYIRSLLTAKAGGEQGEELDNVAFGLANDIQAMYDLEIGAVPDIEKMVVEAVKPLLAAKTGEPPLRALEEEAFTRKMLEHLGFYEGIKRVQNLPRHYVENACKELFPHFARPVVSREQIVAVFEDVLRDKIMIIENNHHSYYGSPQELIDKFSTAIHHLLEGKKG